MIRLEEVWFWNEIETVLAENEGYKLLLVSDIPNEHMSYEIYSVKNKTYKPCGYDPWDAVKEWNKLVG